MSARAWHEAAVLRLIKKHRGKDPQALVEQYASDLLTEWRISELPVQVDAITSALGIRRRLGSYPFAGRVYVEPSGQLVMDLNSDDPLSRRRFTCGHEIMHTLFPGFRRESRYRLDRVTGTTDIRRGEEEYLCDRGAAALLMPADLMAASSYRLSSGLASVESLASAAEVSLEAAGNRLSELAPDLVAFIVLDLRHKPADMPALRRGETVPERLRVRYMNSRDLAVHVPRFKSADDDSVFARALQSSSPQSGRERLPGTSSSQLFEIEARAYPRGDGSKELSRVLAVAKPV